MNVWRIRLEVQKYPASGRNFLVPSWNNELCLKHENIWLRAAKTLSNKKASEWHEKYENSRKHFAFSEIDGFVINRILQKFACVSWVPSRFSSSRDSIISCSVEPQYRDKQKFVRHHERSALISEFVIKLWQKLKIEYYPRSKAAKYLLRREREIVNLQANKSVLCSVSSWQ